MHARGVYQVCMLHCVSVLAMGMPGGLWLYCSRLWSCLLPVCSPTGHDKGARSSAAWSAYWLICLFAAVLVFLHALERTWMLTGHQQSGVCRSAPRDPKQPDQPSLAVKWSWPAPQFAAQLGSMSPFPDAWWENADRLAWSLQHEQLPPMRDNSPEGECSTAVTLSVPEAGVWRVFVPLRRAAMKRGQHCIA